MNPEVLKKMRKPAPEIFHKFRDLFEREQSGGQTVSRSYFIHSLVVAQTKCAMSRNSCSKNWKLQQVQDYIPLPMTVAAAMYYSGLDYQTEIQSKLFADLNGANR